MMPDRLYQVQRGKPGWQAVKWSRDDDLTLLKEMVRLRSQVPNQEQAIRELVHDRRKQNLFPYKAGRSNTQRQNTLRARLSTIKKTMMGWDAAFGKPHQGIVDEAMAVLDMASVVKNKRVKLHRS